MEQMQQFIPQEPTNEFDKIQVTGNVMQSELAQRHGEEMYDFIEKHGNDFRVFMDSHPEYFIKFEADPDGTLKEIEENIYH